MSFVRSRSHTCRRIASLRFLLRLCNACWRGTREPSSVGALLQLCGQAIAALGLPMGPDMLLTVRGRKSGVPRTTPVTICDYGGRRGFISPFGEANWARNLRAAGTGTIRIGGRTEEIRAVELKHDEAV
jgi:deazaflavin-dependent oxidoreductase (nitroreductase family)